ncbi:MAG TPA: Chromate resistance protein ChrB [Chloroflexia bacterium]|nr:Chromate resistance protein ChrB [Chloroflexia bacterium]
MHTWLLLHYRVPREPSASRVYVWRKLKRLGALLLHDAIWVLPYTPRTREQLQWLAAEISELEGEAVLWETRLLPGGSLQEESLVRQFTAQAEALYTEIDTALEGLTPDLTTLSRKYRQASLQDYFHSQAGQLLRQKLIAAGEEAQLNDRVNHQKEGTNKG